MPWRSSAFGTDGDTRAGHQRTELSPPRFSEDELADAPLRPVRDIPSSPSASTPAVATQLEEPTAEPPTARTPTREKRPLLADQLETLPVEALRALVFLEETHNAGLVDDAEYRLKRAEIRNGLRENPGSP